MKKGFTIGLFLFLCCLCRSEAYAATKIPSVKVRICVDDFANENEEPELEIEAVDDDFEIAGYEIVDGFYASVTGPARKDEMKNLDGKSENTDLIPTYEIELTAEDGYYFDVMEQKDIVLSGFDATCTKAIRTNNGTTLILTVELPGLKKYIGELLDVQFDKSGKAFWDSVTNAAYYHVMLFKNDRQTGRMQETNACNLDLSAMMKEPGEYTCRVYPYTAEGIRGKGAVSSPVSVKPDEVSKDYKCGWYEEEGSWRYRNEDGVPIQGNWLYENNNWYYFGKDGDMVTDSWIKWKGKNYYVDMEGKMTE